MEEYTPPEDSQLKASKKPANPSHVNKDRTKEVDPFACLPKHQEDPFRERRDNHTLVQINSSHNYSSHECSYSKVAKGSTSCGYRSDQMTPLDYNDMMERGFRRCGEYFYKQDNMKNHWPYYTIRSDATQHKIRKSHQKAWNRWQRYLAGTRDVVEPGDEKDDLEKPPAKPTLEIDTEFLQEIKHRVEAAFEPISKELADMASSLQKPPEETSVLLVSLKCKLAVAPDKQLPGAFFSNLLVLLSGCYKLQSKEVAKAKHEYLVGLLSVPGFVLELQPNGMLRWKRESAGLMQLEDPQESATKATKPEIAGQTKLQPKHLEIKLVPAACTPENFELYKRYCADIHQSKKESQSSYENFLCLKTLVYRELPAKDGVVLSMGCFHMNYYLDGKLVAVGVVDIVPKGMSSVYFFYEPYLKPLKFGIIGGLYEIEYIKMLNKAFPMFKYYYLGFYIQQCDKMNYKADFEPCELLCPKTGRFVELTAERRQAIDKKQVWLDDQPISKEEKEVLEFADLNELKAFLVEKGRFYSEGAVASFSSRSDLKSLAQKICTLRSELLMAFGKKLLQRVVISLD